MTDAEWLRAMATEADTAVGPTHVEALLRRAADGLDERDRLRWLLDAVKTLIEGPPPDPAPFPGHDGGVILAARAPATADGPAGYHDGSPPVPMPGATYPGGPPA